LHQRVLPEGYFRLLCRVWNQQTTWS
jgi:hypothetical protein